MDAPDGVPSALRGIEVLSVDAVRLRIEHLCRGGVQPRLPQIEVKFIALEKDRQVLVIHVPRSWAAPHRVTIGKHAHFYGRKTGSYPLDVDEPRTAFLQTRGIGDKARDFRSARLQRIAAGETPVPVSSAGKLILHVMSMSMSMSAFDANSSASTVPSQAQRHRFAPIGWVRSSSHLNFDGYVSYSNSTTPSVAYTQQFRSGIVEAMLAFEKHRDERWYLVPQWYELLLINWTREYASALAELGSAPPYFVFLSFLGIGDFQLTGNSGSTYLHQRKLDRQNLILPTALLEDTRDINPIMRSLFDMVWNAFGLERSQYFDEASQWIGPSP